MIKRVIVVLGHVAVFSAVVSMAGCRLCECDVDSVDNDAEISVWNRENDANFAFSNIQNDAC